MRAALSVVLLLLLPSAAAAETRYVAPGSVRTAAPCERAAPCTLRYGLDNATAGDEVVMLAGTYPDDGTLDSYYVDTGVTLRGDAGGVRPVLVLGQAPVNLLDGTEEQRARLVGVELRHEGPENAVTVNNWGLIDDVAVTSDSGQGDAGIHIQGDRVLIRNTRVHSRAANAVAIQGTNTAVEPGTTLLNVTAVASGENGVGVQSLGRALNVMGTCQRSNAHMRAINTIARGSLAGMRATVSDPDFCGSVFSRIDSSYSNYNGPVGNVATGAGNQVDDPRPLFADAVFHQRADAPTVDAGGLITGVGGTDLDGDPRKVGADPDIGADEYPAAPGLGAVSVSDVTATSARLSGSFTAGSRPASAAFQWGPTVAYGSLAGATTTPGPLSALLTGLRPDTTYHVRSRAVMPDPQGRTVFSPGVSFTTRPAPTGGGGGLELRAPERIKRRRLLRRGLLVRFAVPADKSAYVARLSAKKGGKRRTLVRRRAENQAAGEVAVRLKPRKRKLRRLKRRFTARLVVTVTPPGGTPVRAVARIRVR